MGPKAKAASPLLRRIGVALKTLGLYPPPSPVADGAVAELLDGLRHYIDTYGPLVVRVSKQSIHVEDVTFKDLASASLAFHLYTRKVVGVTFLHGVTARDLTVFLTAVRRDRALLDDEGGVARILLAEAVTGVSVAEVLLALTQSSQPEGVEAADDLLTGGVLSGRHRQEVMEVLRAGPPAIVGLLEHLHTIITESSAPGAPADFTHTAHHLVESLDAMIAGEPAEDRERLHANLAAAVLLLGEPIRRPMEQALATQVSDNDTARQVLYRLATQRLVSLIPLSALHGDVPATLSPHAGDDHSRPFADQKTEQELGLDAGALVQAEGPDEGDEDGPRVTAAYADEARALGDEDAVTRDIIGTLVDALRSQQADQDLTGISGSLAQALSWLSGRHDYAYLRATLQRLEAAVETNPAVDGVLSDIVGDVLQESVLRDMLGRLWGSGTGQDAEDVRACLAFLVGHSVPLLMQVLAVEPRASARRNLCDLIVDIARDEIDTVAAFIEDGRWHLVRNTVNILGRLGNPRAIPYLTQLTTHPEYRVRREAVEALVRLGTDEAEAGIAAFLGDGDVRIRLKSVLSLNDAGVYHALPALLAMLEQADLFGRQVPVKEAVVTAVARAAAPGAVPALEHLARRHALAPWNRRLRRQARDALTRIAARGSVGEPSPPALDVQTGGL